MIQREREKRVQWQVEMDVQEEEQANKDAVLAKNRRVAAENKDRAHEEREEEDLRQLRLRWKAADAEKARLIKEARERKERDLANQIEEDKKAEAQAKATQSKRETAWASRDKRVQSKRD